MSKEPMAARRSAASRAAILEAAFHLVGEVGYGKLSIEAIAARAGVGKQTIYRWWPSKGAVLFEAVFVRSFGDTENPAPLPDTGDLEADLRTVLRAIVLELADPEVDRPLRALTVAMLEDEALAREYRTRVEEPTREAKRARLRSAQRAGQLPASLDLDAAVDAIFAPMAQRWLHRAGPLTEEYADALLEITLGGLRRSGPN
ncbi:TetR/AcrR family transcriptional regulator [Streptomyces sp. URMC 125]|uniref:TetR/AcrR family transcriptional regulator n=1 Tax=Streptomyces sp. URMC 125 TaxID=3423419 RepID=UPI003F1DB684